MRPPGQLGRWIGLGSLYVLLFLLPFSKAAIELAFGGLLIGWLVERADPATRRQTLWFQPSFRPLLVAVAAFLGVCALSIAVSRHPHESARGFVGKWLEYLLFFIFVADLGARPRVARRAGNVMAASSFFVLVEALTQELFGKGLFRHVSMVMFQRMSGPYQNPIDFATYLMVAIPILLALAAGGPLRPWRAGLWVLAAALIACLGRTLAFGAWVAFGAALAWLAWRERALRRPALATGVAVLLAAGFFMVRRGEWYLLSFSDVGTKDRVFMWQAALGMILDRPLLGHGINTFMANYLDYWVGGEQQPRYAHNCYLQMTAETGLIGLAAFLWLLWLVFARVERALQASRGSGDRVLLAGLAAGLLAFAIQSGYDTNFYAMRQVAMFWALAGLAVGLSARLTGVDT